jgi:hypothetical protein
MSRKDLTPPPPPPRPVDVTIKAIDHGVVVFDKTYTRIINYDVTYDNQQVEIELTDSMGKDSTQSFFNLAVIVTEG